MRKRTPSGPYRRYDRETRIGACADYLLGKKVYHIEAKWNVHRATVLNWIRKTGHFKMRGRSGNV